MTSARLPRLHEVIAASRDPRLLRAREASERNIEWRTQGRCRTAKVDPETWYPLPTEPADMALAICRGCDVQPDCLAFALNAGDCEGIWGATTPRERRAMLVAWAKPVAEPVVVPSEPIEVTPGPCPEGHTQKRNTKGHPYCPTCRAELAQRTSPKRRAGTPDPNRPCAGGECSVLLDEYAPTFQRYCSQRCRRRAKEVRAQERQAKTPRGPSKAERNAARAERVRGLAATGLSDAAIGRRMGIALWTVWSIRNQHGIPPGQRVAQARHREQVRRLLNDGLSDREIAGQMRIAVSTVAYQRSCIRAEDLQQVPA